MTTEHRWSYDRSNGFWAHCKCGFSSFSFFDSVLRRRMDRHVRDLNSVSGVAK